MSYRMIQVGAGGAASTRTTAKTYARHTPAATIRATARNRAKICFCFCSSINHRHHI